MNKKIMWAVIIVLILILLAWNYSSPATQESATNDTKKMTTETVPDNPTPAYSPESSSISSIQDAMKSGKPMRCTYTIGKDEKSVRSTVTVDGNKFLAETTISGVSGHVLSNGETQYIWSDSPNKQGFSMSKACLDTLASSLKNTPASGSVSQPKDITKDFETASEVKCEPAENTDFSIPSDITFTDQCAMMQKGMEMMKQYQNTPSN